MNQCLGCGAATGRKWCSSACHAKSRRLGSEFSCARCGSKFYLRPAEVRKGSGAHCSVACRRAHEAEGSSDYARIGRRRAHRVVAERMLGRPLAPGEVVHHRDGSRRNNDPSNLEVFASNAEHMRAHAAEGPLGFATHEAAVAAGRRSGEVRRARKLSPHCVEQPPRQPSLFDARRPEAP